MSINTNSYGHPNDIAAMVPRWANSSKLFDASTRPTLGEVETWVNQVSGVLNVILAQFGFSIPVTQADALEMLELFVNQEVAAITEGVNGSGRFGPTSKQVGKQGRFAIITGDVRDFVESVATGLERLGVTRTHSFASGIGYRGTDENGDTVEPLFQRAAFGNTVISG